MVLKGDSCLLNGGKPMFVPEWTKELGVTPCIILRISRLGKSITQRFAGRYYDAVALGADFIALDKWREAVERGEAWTESIGFDFSLALGRWIEKGNKSEQVMSQEEWLMTPEEAIEHVSHLMTIRQGDMIYIPALQGPRPVIREEIIRKEIDGEEMLYCKIK